MPWLEATPMDHRLQFVAEARLTTRILETAREGGLLRCIVLGIRRSSALRPATSLRGGWGLPPRGARHALGARFWT